jgi:hypothetical protein
MFNSVKERHNVIAVEVIWINVHSFRNLLDMIGLDVMGFTTP